MVYCILQDRKGFMWFGTQEGLNKYDGSRFTIYRNISDESGSLPDSCVTTMFEDSGGDLWIGLLGGTMARYDRDNDRFIRIPLNEENDVPLTEFVYCIREDTDRNILIGTYGGGLKKIYKNSGQILHYLKQSSGDSVNRLSIITSMVIKENGSVWAGTWNDGVVMLDINSDSGNSIHDVGERRDELKRVYCMMQDRKGNVWAGTNGGLRTIAVDGTVTDHSHDPDDEFSISSNGLRAVYESAEGVIYAGTKDRGLNILGNNGKFRTMRYQEEDESSLSSDSVISIYQDRSGLMWIGTIGGGLCILDLKPKKFHTVRKAGPHAIKDVHSILVDSENKKWIGTSRSGIFILNDEDELVEVFTDDDANGIRLINKFVTKFHEDKNSNVWFCTIDGGLFKHDRKSGKIRKISTEVSSDMHSFAYYNDHLWLGTSNHGVLKFDLSSETLKEYALQKDLNSLLKDDKIYCLHFDDKGVLWIGTKSNGLIRMNPENNEITNFRHDKDDPSSISDDFILTVSGRGNEIWVGTYSGSLNKLDLVSGKFTRFKDTHGIPHNIKAIIPEDETNIWISSNYGLTKFNSESGRLLHFKAEDGLQSNEFNDNSFCVTDNGDFYFGGINGISYFKPGEITENSYIPDIAITGFQIFNMPIQGTGQGKMLKKSISEADEIFLTYRERVFSFEFASLTFNNPEKNKYAYMLHGFDDDWVHCDNRKFVTYTNLEPGNYVFWVKGTNDDGVWNEKGVSLRISISPPFWKTFWFKSLGVLSVAGATALAYRQKLNKVEQQKLSQQQFSRKLIESQENERKRISQELHDTIAHDILITKNKAMMGLRNAGDPEEMKSLLNEISELSTGTLNDVRTITYNLHPHQIRQLGITKALKSIINKATDSSEIIFKCEIQDIDNLLSRELEINVFRIIHECLNNILKHSGATRSEIRILHIDSSLLAVISDNGKGFETSGSSGLGMKGIEERIRIYDGSFNIETARNKGTLIHILLPIK